LALDTDFLLFFLRFARTYRVPSFTIREFPKFSVLYFGNQGRLEHILLKKAAEVINPVSFRVGCDYNRPGLANKHFAELIWIPLAREGAGRLR
jgi:hypothetical protein